MKVRHLLFLLALLIPVNAQAKDSFMPVSAWQVSPLSISSSTSTKPSLCVMTSQFEDGTVIRLTSGNGRIPGFSIGGYYGGDEFSLSLSFLGTENMTTSIRKLDDKTIMGKFKDSVAVHKILSSSSYNAPLIIGFNGEKYNYYSGDIKAGLMRVKECLKGNGGDVKSAQKSPRNMPQQKQEVEKDVINLEADITLANDGTIIEKAQLETDAGTWQAKRGEDLKDVLARWSKQSGIELIWSAENSVRLPENVAYDGDFNNAVQQLLHKVSRGAMQGEITTVNDDDVMAAIPAVPVQSEVLGEITKKIGAKSSGVKVLPVSRGETKKHNGREPVYIRRNTVHRDVDPIKKTPERITNSVLDKGTIYETQKWRALKGTSLRGVINAWSEYAEVEVNWLIKQDYALRESVSMVSQYGDALRVLLSQYDNVSKKPMAKIYFDKNTGSGTVVIFEKEPKISVRQ